MAQYSVPGIKPLVRASGTVILRKVYGWRKSSLAGSFIFPIAGRPVHGEHGKPLNAHPAHTKACSSPKKEPAKKYPEDREKYSEEHNEFIKKTLQLTRKVK